MVQTLSFKTCTGRQTPFLQEYSVPLLLWRSDMSRASGAQIRQFVRDILAAA